MNISIPKFAWAACIALFTACSSVPTSKSQLPVELAQVAGVSVSSIQYSDAVRFSDHPTRERFVQFSLGAYAQTQSQVILFHFDKNKNLFRVARVISLGEVRSAKVATRGAFQHLKQLQIEYKDGFVALNFSNSSDAEAGYASDTDPAVKALEKAGVRNTQTDFWFIPEELRGFRLPIAIPK